jgi:magnesium transporter
VLLYEAKRVGRAVRNIRTDILQLDDQMDRDPAAVSLDQILSAKDQLLRLLSVSEEQLECFEAVTEPGIDALDFSKLKGSARLLLAAAGSTERMANRLEKRVADLRQRYDAHQQEKLNHRLAILTILSAVFLPLTLIAGIWGMNFEQMPELGLPVGYPMALTTMALIAGILLWIFHRNGWFD